MFCYLNENQILEPYLKLKAFFIKRSYFLLYNICVFLRSRKIAALQKESGAFTPFPGLPRTLREGPLLLRIHILREDLLLQCPRTQTPGPLRPLHQKAGPRPPRNFPRQPGGFLHHPPPHGGQRQ